MNNLSLALANLLHKPLSALLSVLLFALSIGLISLLLNFRAQADRQFDNNLAGINLVVGAKGSPLELVLNSMYHVGYPNGNVKLGEVQSFFNPSHPIVADAVPLSLGDAYRGYRIVGTTPDLIDWYGGEIAAGLVFAADFNAVIGTEVAQRTGLKLGDQFQSSHGIIDEGADRIEHDGEFRVVGVLAESGTVLDQLVLTTNQTYWHSHDAHAGDAHGGFQSKSHEGHDHSAVHPLLEEDPEKEITSVLVRYQNPSSFQALNFPRNINENTELLAANPAYEISEVRRRFDTGQRLLGILVLAITVISALSIFISLFNSLRERRYELAMLRVMGAGRPRVFGLIFTEGLLLALAGYVLGILLSHLILTLLAANITAEFRYSLDPWAFLAEEAYLLGGALLLAALAALVPAIQAARADVGETLVGES